MEPNRKTLGQKVVDFLPSQHSDPKRKAEQERGLQEIVDLLVPQSKTEIALSVLPLGFIGKYGKKGLKDAVEAFNNYQKTGGMNKETFKMARDTGLLTNQMHREFKEMKTYLTDWVNTYRGPINQKVNVKNIKNTEMYLDDLKLDESGMTLGRYNADLDIVQANRKVFYDADMTQALSENFKRTPSDLRKTNFLHELVHALTKGTKQFSTTLETVIEKAKFDSIEELGAMVMPGAPFKRMASGRIAPIDKKYHTYLSKPTEIFARVFELRYDLNESAKNLAKQNVRLKTDLFNKNKAYTELRAVLSHKQIENLYNNLPAMLPLGMFGKGKLNDKDK
tara:strand:- start:514 stop:1521 length:1008 start_codon:yes stop_codon:yes gene_type:complete